MNIVFMFDLLCCACVSYVVILTFTVKIATCFTFVPTEIPPTACSIYVIKF